MADDVQQGMTGSHWFVGIAVETISMCAFVGAAEHGSNLQFCNYWEGEFQGVAIKAYLCAAVK